MNTGAVMNAGIVALVIVTGLPGKTSTWSFDAGQQPEVNVSNINGQVTVEGGSGSKVTIEATLAERRESQEKWTVEARAEGGKVYAEVCCGPCEEKRRNCSDAPDVKLSVKVPERSMLDISTVNAPVIMSRVQGRSEVATVNGKVDVSGTSSALQVSTVAGDVRIVPSGLEKMSVNTVSGDVKLELPSNPDAQLSYSAVSGKLNGKAVALGSKQKTFGSGRARIDVSTVSGELNVNGG